MFTPASSNFQSIWVHREQSPGKRDNRKGFVDRTKGRTNSFHGWHNLAWKERPSRGARSSGPRAAEQDLQGLGGQRHLPAGSGTEQVILRPKDIRTSRPREEGQEVMTSGALVVTRVFPLHRHVCPRGLEPLQEATFQLQKRMREGGIYSLCFSEQRAQTSGNSGQEGVHPTQSGSAPETLRYGSQQISALGIHRKKTRFKGSNQIKIWNPSRPGEIKSHPPRVTGALNKKVTPQWEKTIWAEIWPPKKQSLDQN